jgi:peptide/nickel transport system permease protein
VVQSTKHLEGKGIAQDEKSTTERSRLSRETIRSAPGLYSRAWQRFSQNRPAVIALVLCCVIILFVLSAGLISRYVTGYSYSENHLDAKLTKPFTGGYILGADGNGRDILTRLAYGGRASLLIAFLATLSTLLIGAVVGSVAGYFGRWVDSLLMRLVDVLLSIPTLSLLILISTLYRPGVIGLSLFIASVSWAGVSRLIRGEVLALRNREYVEAARVIGAPTPRILVRHILPNVVPIMVVWGSLAIPGLILTEASLSYLGLGVRVPAPSWGNMLQESQQFYLLNWTNVFFPGFMIFLSVLCVNMVGNGLRDALDPRLTN